MNPMLNSELLDRHKHFINCHYTPPRPGTIVLLKMLFCTAAASYEDMTMWFFFKTHIPASLFASYSLHVFLPVPIAFIWLCCSYTTSSWSSSEWLMHSVSYHSDWFTMSMAGIYYYYMTSLLILLWLTLLSFFILFYYFILLCLLQWSA